MAGISVGVDLGQDVIIDAVSKGFDGREVSKSICNHERYFIPWYDLRKINIGNFKKYQAIPNLIWLSVIKNLIKQLEKNEDILMS